MKNKTHLVHDAQKVLFYFIEPQGVLKRLINHKETKWIVGTQNFQEDSENKKTDS